MSRLSTLYIVGLTFYANHVWQTASEVLHCNGACGPCRVSNELCNLRCIGYESCKDDRLTCGSSTTKIADCTFDCNAEKACIYSTMYATNVYSETNVNCAVGSACEGAIIFAGQGSSIFLNCDAEDSCAGLQLHGFNAESVYVNCIGLNSCEHASIECGTGDCIINCLNTQGGVCQNLNLGCGSSPNCKINCQGGNKCTGIRVNVNNAIGFECVGSPTDCTSAPAPFMLPTRAPTPSPTRSPTPAPTRPPTPRPTANPTRSPTPAPTGNPTLRPTRTPTRSPTRNPTMRPTRNPTKNPTDRPTNFPTKFPTPSPTDRPTAPPTPRPTPAPVPTRDPTPAPTDRPSESPTKRPSNSPTTPLPTGSPVEVIVINTAIDNRRNDVEGGSLSADGADATQGYLIITSIVIGVCILGCIPLCLFLYRRVNENSKNKQYVQEAEEEEEEEVLENVPVAPANTPMIGGPPRNLRSLQKFNARGRQFSGHDEGNFHDDLEMVAPRRVDLQRVESKSVTKEVTKDGYSSQYGFSNAGNGGMTMAYGMMTNAPRRNVTRGHNPADALQPVSDDLEHGGGFLDDAAITRDIIKVTVWFIEKVKLPQYCELFILNGFTNMDAISAITSMDQLLLLGIERRDHRYQIMRQIHKLNNEYDSDADILEDGYAATGAAAGDTLAQCESERPRRTARGPRRTFSPLKHEEEEEDDDEEDDQVEQLQGYEVKQHRSSSKHNKSGKSKSKGSVRGNSANSSGSQGGYVGQDNQPKPKRRKALKNRVRPQQAQRHHRELQAESSHSEDHDPELSQDMMDDVMAPVETLGIPPEHEDRVKVIRGPDGGQIWQIDDVMEQDIVHKKQKKRQQRGGGDKSARYSNNSETHGVLPAEKTKGSGPGKNRSRRMVKQPTISSVEGSRMDDVDVEVEQMENSDSHEQNDRDLMMEMINISAPGSSNSESGVFRRR